jgi:acetate kinase
MLSVLTINAGSSSLKAAAFDLEASAETEIWHSNLDCTEHLQATQSLLAELATAHPTWHPHAIGHRVVHGGTRFNAPIEITADVLQTIADLTPLAPLHQPANIAGIQASQYLFPTLPQVACFDTAFHRGRDFVHEAYALPRHYYDQGIRRYGFHGLSYQFICDHLQNQFPEMFQGKIIICHLGNGASMAAVHAGRCVETTMGFTPTDGLVMGTRSGQIDPGVLLHFINHEKLSAPQILQLLTKKSGLMGVSNNFSSDMRALLDCEKTECREAIDMFVYRCQYFIGALTAALQGLDGLVFTAGIGEHAHTIREKIVSGLHWLGAELDPIANAQPQQKIFDPKISTPHSRSPILVLPTDEERTIARAVYRLLAPAL